MNIRKKIALIIFGLFLAVVILEAGLRLGGFAYTSLRRYGDYACAKQKGEYRILCLGESTTANQYPSLLGEILNNRCREIKFKVIDQGIPAITTAYIVSHIEENIGRFKPHMVVVMMGINDEEELAPGFKAMISELDTFWAFFKTVKLFKFIWLNIAQKQSRRAGQAQGPPARLECQDQPDSDIYTPDAICVERGHECLNLGKYAEAEAEFIKAITVNPQNDRAYALLIWTYACWDKHSEAEACFASAMKNNPSNHEAYYWMGWGHRKLGKKLLAEDCFKKAINIFPQNDSPYIELYSMYMQSKDFSKAKEILMEAVDACADSIRVKKALSALSVEMGDYELGRKYAAKARSRMKDSTTANYKRLWAILKKNRIKLVCAQYPTRDVRLLMDIFGKESGVIFVDNEHKFREGVRKEGLRAYFSDMFAGDFGHCTAKGNRLLAQNMANVILKEAFGKYESR